MCVSSFRRNALQIQKRISIKQYPTSAEFAALQMLLIRSSFINTFLSYSEQFGFYLLCNIVDMTTTGEVLWNGGHKHTHTRTHTRTRNIKKLLMENNPKTDFHILNQPMLRLVLRIALLWASVFEFIFHFTCCFSFLFGSPLDGWSVVRYSLFLWHFASLGD